MSRKSTNPSPNPFFNETPSQSGIPLGISIDTTNAPSSPGSNRSESAFFFQKRDPQECENLAKVTIENLLCKNFDSLIFDFDGTLTKRHTIRQSSFTEEVAARDWFADKELLEKILEEGKNQGIKFYIASKQTVEILRMVLRAHNLEGYFTEIHGGNEDKEIAIRDIAARHTKVLYLDDDAENVRDLKNVTLVHGLLEKLSPFNKMIGRDLEGGAGLDFEKWEKVLDCLERDMYNLTPQRFSSLGSPSGSFEGFLENEDALQVTSSLVGIQSSTYHSELESESIIGGKPSSPFGVLFPGESGIFVSQLTRGDEPVLNSSHPNDFLRKKSPVSSLFDDDQEIADATNVEKYEVRKKRAKNRESFDRYGS
jgi:hypothetical protein